MLLAQSDEGVRNSAGIVDTGAPGAPVLRSARAPFRTRQGGSRLCMHHARSRGPDVAMSLASRDYLTCRCLNVLFRASGGLAA